MKALLSYDLKFTHPNLLDSPGFHPFMELPPKAFVSRYCHLLESFLSLSRIALDIIEWKRATRPHCIRLLICWSWNSLQRANFFPNSPCGSGCTDSYLDPQKKQTRSAFIFPHKVENFFVNSATTFLTQFLKKISEKKRLTAGAEIFIKRQKKEVLQYLTSEEELFDAAKATVATNREKQGGSLGVPWQICIQ